MIIKTAIKLSVMFIIILLSGCDSFKNDSLSNICKNSPELCEDLHQIDDCRFKRSTVIRARHYDKIEPTEHHKRQLLNQLDEYHSCLEVRLFLEYKRNKNRKVLRLQNYLRTQELIKQQLSESRGTQDPMLAYYLWTHHQDMQARNVFLRAATKSDVTDPRLLFKLATVNAKDTPQKALNLFYKAMVMTDSLEQIPTSSFIFIMNIFYQKKQFENAYVWALIAKKEDKKEEFPINLELILSKGIRSGGKLIKNDEALQDKSDNYYEQLQDGDFTAKSPLL